MSLMAHSVHLSPVYQVWLLSFMTLLINLRDQEIFIYTNFSIQLIPLFFFLPLTCCLLILGREGKRGEGGREKEGRGGGGERERVIILFVPPICDFIGWFTYVP